MGSIQRSAITFLKDASDFNRFHPWYSPTLANILWPSGRRCWCPFPLVVSHQGRFRPSSNGDKNGPARCRNQDEHDDGTKSHNFCKKATVYIQYIYISNYIDIYIYKIYKVNLVIMENWFHIFCNFWSFENPGECAWNNSFGAVPWQLVGQSQGSWFWTQCHTW